MSPPMVIISPSSVLTSRTAPEHTRLTAKTWVCPKTRVCRKDISRKSSLCYLSRKVTRHPCGKGYHDTALYKHWHYSCWTNPAPIPMLAQSSWIQQITILDTCWTASVCFSFYNHNGNCIRSLQANWIPAQVSYQIWTHPRKGQPPNWGDMCWQTHIGTHGTLMTYSTFVPICCIELGPNLGPSFFRFHLLRHSIHLQYSLMHHTFYTSWMSVLSQLAVLMV